MSIADAAKMKKVGVTALYWFYRTEGQQEGPSLHFREAGGMIWVTVQSLEKWTPRPWRHLRPENVGKTTFQK